jgi:hypothetical protein
MTKGRLKIAAAWATIIGAIVGAMGLVNALGLFQTATQSFSRSTPKLEITRLELADGNSNMAQLLGRTELPERYHQILTTPIRTNSTYVQPESVAVRRDGLVSSIFALGTDQQGCGEEFEIKLIAVTRPVPPGILHETGESPADATSVPFTIARGPCRK